MDTVLGASRFEKFLNFVSERSKVMERLRIIEATIESWRNYPTGAKPTCNYCGNSGHDTDACYKKNKDEGRTLGKSHWKKRKKFHKQSDKCEVKTGVNTYVGRTQECVGCK